MDSTEAEEVQGSEKEPTMGLAECSAVDCIHHEGEVVGGYRTLYGWCCGRFVPQYKAETVPRALWFVCNNDEANAHHQGFGPATCARYRKHHTSTEIAAELIRRSALGGIFADEVDRQEHEEREANRE